MYLVKGLTNIKRRHLLKISNRKPFSKSLKYSGKEEKSALLRYYFKRLG